jgi:hypothetical protein
MPNAASCWIIDTLIDTGTRQHVVSGLEFDL